MNGREYRLRRNHTGQSKYVEVGVTGGLNGKARVYLTDCRLPRKVVDRFFRKTKPAKDIEVGLTGGVGGHAGVYAKP